MTEAVTLPKLLTEAAAYETYGHLLEDKELRRARVDGRIGFYEFKKKIHYREDELIGYFEDRLLQQERDEAGPVNCFVYFITVAGRDNAPIKIGRSANVELRRGKLQSAHFEELITLGYIRGGEETEKLLKNRFQRQRIRGEWFIRTPALLSLMLRLIAHPRGRSTSTADLERLRRIIRHAPR